MPESVSDCPLICDRPHAEPLPEPGLKRTRPHVHTLIATSGGPTLHVFTPCVSCLRFSDSFICLTSVDCRHLILFGMYLHRPAGQILYVEASHAVQQKLFFAKGFDERGLQPNSWQVKRWTRWARQTRAARVSEQMVGCLLSLFEMSFLPFEQKKLYKML